MGNDTEHRPYVPADKKIPELTVLSFVLGLLLSIIMGAANTYLGLYAGMTVSASIPAAVISMVILRVLLARGTILENNIVQTMASSGEALAAGVIFTIPALVITKSWHEFEFWPTTLIAMTGGLLGILFMIPLRQAIVIEEKELKYPEGVACAEVLKTGDEGGKGGGSIFLAILIGGFYKFLIQGFNLLKGHVEWAFAAKKSVFYFGSECSLALLSVGYIVGPNIGSLIFIGGLLGWAVGIPIYTAFYGVEAGSPLDLSWSVWSTQIRYVGVGAMALGGLWTIINCRGGIKKGLKKIFEVKSSKNGEELRTEQELRRRTILPLGIVTTILVYFLYRSMTHDTVLSITATILMVIASFFFVAVASYIVGLVGSSNSPVSGMTICSLLFAAAVLLLFGVKGTVGVIAVLGIAGVVCCATCSSGDICQDLKTGYIVGATPRKQQIVQIFGTVIPAFIFAPILTILHKAYTIGSPELVAPQAVLFSKLSEAFFLDKGELPWKMFWVGVGVALLVILLDEVQKKRGSSFRLHVMAVAVGIYLPLQLSTPIFLGGMIYQIVKNRTKILGGLQQKTILHKGILISSGLIAGEALMGILVAGLIVAGESYESLKPPFTPFGIQMGHGPEWITAAAFFSMLLIFTSWILKREKA